MLRIILAILFVGVVIGDPVTRLPGYPGELPSKMDAGYITVNASAGRALYYVFVESQRSPMSDPLVLWLNGGPGCSSLLAFWTEHGPFKMKSAELLERNEYAWVTVSNMIYVESPAGVGYSYSNTTSDYVTGDKATADDAYLFLVAWFEKFPQYKKHPFWVTGESYAGHYVPNLVHRIRQGNAASKDPINLVGMMAGNPWTDPELDSWGIVSAWWHHSMISNKTWMGIKEHCDWRTISYWISFVPGSHKFQSSRVAGLPPPVPHNKCFDLMNEAWGQWKDIYIYDMYADVCVPGARQLPGEIYDPCDEINMRHYMNIPAVRKALHVSDVSPKTWYECTKLVNYSTNDAVNISVLPIYQELMDTDMHVLVYSGDHDAAVPFEASRRWIAALNRPIVKDFHMWYVDTNGKQVGGWATQYDRLTFTTVRGAGHMIPTKQPQRAIFMYNSFLTNHSLP